MRFSDVPWMRALSAAVKTSGYALIEEDGGRVLRIMDPSKLPMETRIFRFKHIRPDEYFKARISTHIGLGDQYSSGEPIRGFTLLDTLRNMLTRSPAPIVRGSTVGRLDYDKVSNSLLVVDTRPTLDGIETLIRQLDVEPVQVLLDVTIVTTSNKDLIQMVTNWSSISDGGTTIGGVSDPSGGDVGQANGRYPFNVGPGPARTPSSAPGATPLTDDDMWAALRLFSQDPDTEFIMRPNVAIRSDAGARIDCVPFVGEEIHAHETDRRPSPFGASGSSIPMYGPPPPPGVLQVTLGILPGGDASSASDLSIMPHPVVGTNKFIITVIPPNESLSGNLPQVEGLGESEVDWRCKRPATLLTHLLVESGQTVVLAWPRSGGGRQTPPKLPFVGETSLLGQMFRRLAERESRDRIFLFVQPHSVRVPPSSQGRREGR